MLVVSMQVKLKLTKIGSMICNTVKKDRCLCLYEYS